MKLRLLILLLSLFCVIEVKSQSIIVFTNGPTYLVVTNINVFPTTIVYKEGSAAQKVEYISDNLIDFSRGQYLGANITKNITFAVFSMPTNLFQGTFYYDNPQRLKIDFIASIPIVWMNNLPPTNNAAGCILFEQVFGQLRATQ